MIKGLDDKGFWIVETEVDKAEEVLKEVAIKDVEATLDKLEDEGVIDSHELGIKILLKQVSLGDELDKEILRIIKERCGEY